MTEEADAIVVGSGPNGLAAAIVLAQAGKTVRLYESEGTVGGGVRSGPLENDGCIHDFCSAFYPLGLASPFFRELPLARYGLEWIHAPAPLAHPFDDGTAAVLERSPVETGATFASGEDARHWQQLFTPLVEQWDALIPPFLGPLRFPRHPLQAAAFGLRAIQPASFLCRRWFQGQHAQGLFAGIAAHSFLPLEKLASASFGLVLGGAGHAVGWPIVKGGAQQLSNALASHFQTLGGTIHLGHAISRLEDLPRAQAYLFDVGPRQLVQICGARLPQRFQRRLHRFRYGSGAFKVDFVLSDPIPWRGHGCYRASTIHLGGSLEEISVAERECWRGEAPEKPFVLVGQQSLFDPARAPAGRHTCWSYAHVPHGSPRDYTEAIEGQIERFAPGFRDTILARHVRSTAGMEAYNVNNIGGDINGGSAQLSQLFTRPVAQRHPYTTPAPDIFLCSASTPPGGGVHGMCGYFAARTALKRRWP